MGLSALSHEKGDFPLPVGQKGQGESASESCQLSAEPDLSVMLQVASLLWCAVKLEATKCLLEEAGYLISQLRYFLFTALYAVSGYCLAKVFSYFPRPLYDCCSVLPCICCAEWVCDNEGKSTKWISSQWNCHVPLDMVGSNYLTTLEFSNKVYFVLFCCLLTLPACTDTLSMACSESPMQNVAGLVFVREFCFERKGLIFFCALLYPLLCCQEGVPTLKFHLSEEKDPGAVNHSSNMPCFGSFAISWSAINSSSWGASQLPRSLLLPSWCQLDQVAEGLIQVSFAYIQRMEVPPPGEPVPVFDLPNIKPFSSFWVRIFPTLQLMSAAFCCSLGTSEKCLPLSSLHLLTSYLKTAIKCPLSLLQAERI